MLIEKQTATAGPNLRPLDARSSILAIVSANGEYSRKLVRVGSAQTLEDMARDVALLPNIQIAIGNEKMASLPASVGRKRGADIAPAGRISSIIQQFVASSVSPRAAGIASAMVDAQLKGNHEEAALMRIMISWMLGMREGTQPVRARGLRQSAECARMAGSLVCSGRWRFQGAAESCGAEKADLLMQVNAESLVELSCVNSERDNEFKAAAKIVAAEANEAIWPASPFLVKRDGSSNSLCFDFVAAEAAIVCSAMSGSEWAREWMAKGCPDSRSLAETADISVESMLSRLWMDDADPFSRGVGGAERDRWRASRAGGDDPSLAMLGDARSKGRGLGRSKGFILGLNLGAHLILDHELHAQNFGSQMLFNLAEQGADASVAAALSSLVEPAKKSGMDATVVLELLARVEALGIQRQAPQNDGSSRKPRARSL